MKSRPELERDAVKLVRRLFKATGLKGIEFESKAEEWDNGTEPIGFAVFVYPKILVHKEYRNSSKAYIRPKGKPCIFVYYNYEHKTVSINGGLSAYVKIFRHRIWNESEVCFLSYKFARNYNIEDLYEQARLFWHERPDLFEMYNGLPEERTADEEIAGTENEAVDA